MCSFETNMLHLSPHSISVSDSVAYFLLMLRDQGTKKGKFSSKMYHCIIIVETYTDYGIHVVLLSFFLLNVSFKIPFLNEWNDLL